MSHDSPHYYNTPGLGSVGSYQVSAMPFLSGGITVQKDFGFKFPFVTSWICISSSGPVRVAMSKHGAETAKSAYFTVDTNATKISPTFNIKATEIHFSAAAHQVVDVIVGLTNIPAERIDYLSGSAVGNKNAFPIVGPNWSGSRGIG
tara:strand:- start:81215 stop:81655 length:441 start_codon:yes stop_codon:yes gene_type:complete